MSTNRRLLAVLLVLGLVVSACSSDPDGSAEQDSTATTGPDSGSSGDGDNGGSDQGSSDPGATARPDSVSDEFDVAIPAGWTRDALGDIGMTDTSGVQLIYELDRYDELVAFYDDWTSQQEDEYVRTESATDVTYVRNSTAIEIISVSNDYEEQGVAYAYVVIATGESN